MHFNAAGYAYGDVTNKSELIYQITFLFFIQRIKHTEDVFSFLDVHHLLLRGYAS